MKGEYFFQGYRRSHQTGNVPLPTEAAQNERRGPTQWLLGSANSSQASGSSLAEEMGWPMEQAAGPAILPPFPECIVHIPSLPCCRRLLLELLLQDLGNLLFRFMREN